MNRLSRAFTDNKPLLGYVEGFGPVFEGDTYCIRHQELLTLGLEDEDTCAYCEWGDPTTEGQPLNYLRDVLEGRINEPTRQKRQPNIARKPSKRIS